MDELFFTKRGNKWECYDKEGHSAIGFSKDQARSNYYLKYKVQAIQETGSIDISKYNNI